MNRKISAYYRLARLDKPVGIWLLFLPCCFGLALAKSTDIYIYALFGIGAIAMRSAGCAINDIVDKNFDAKVERTKNRPVASGEISVVNALIFIALLLSIGLLVLLQLPWAAIKLGLLATPLIIAYPFMKRITYWPQLFLGITFNLGVLIAYTTIHQTLTPEPLILYIGCIFWTLGYDTIYAHQDKKDDLKIGVKSTALALGKNTKLAVGIFYILFLATIFFSNQTLSNLNLLALTLLGFHFLWQIKTLDINNPQNCLKRFKSNVITGILAFLSIFSI